MADAPVEEGEEEELEEEEVSDPDARLDRMVAAASVPNLASLFQRGKDAGLLKPAVEYTASS